LDDWTIGHRKPSIRKTNNPAARFWQALILFQFLFFASGNSFFVFVALHDFNFDFTVYFIKNK